jgi:hypothetical protein
MSPQIYEPRSVQDASRLLQELGGDGAVIGGGTWIMRAQLRNEEMRSAYVSLRAISEATRIEQGDPMRIGAAVTHEQLSGVGCECGPLFDFAHELSLARQSAADGVDPSHCGPGAGASPVSL